MRKLIYKTKCFFCVPLIQCFGFLGTFYCFLFLYIYFAPGQIDVILRDYEMSEEIKNTVKSNCPDSYITWIQLDQKIFSDRYIFKDVVGKDVIQCERSGHKICEVGSVKKYNPFYLTSHKVDLKSYYFLNSFKRNKVEHFKDLRKLKNYNAIIEGLNAPYIKLTDAYFAVVKGKIFENGVKIKVAYLFILANTNQSKIICAPIVAEESLKNLLLKAEGNI